MPLCGGGLSSADRNKYTQKKSRISKTFLKKKSYIHNFVIVDNVKYGHVTTLTYTQLYWLNKRMHYTVHSSASQHLNCLSMTSPPTIERMSSPVPCCVVHAEMHCSLSTSLLFLRAFHYCQRFRDHKVVLPCWLFLGWWHWASVCTLKMSCNSVKGFLIITTNCM